MALCGGLLSGADEKAVQRSADPELTALQEQNAIIEQRIKLSVQQQTLLRSGLPAARPPDGGGERYENVTIESLRNAYTALAGVARADSPGARARTPHAPERSPGWLCLREQSL